MKMSLTRNKIVELNKTHKKVYFIGSGYEVVKQVIVEATDNKSALKEAMKMYHNHKWNFDFCEIEVSKCL